LCVKFVLVFLTVYVTFALVLYFLPVFWLFGVLHAPYAGLAASLALQLSGLVLAYRFEGALVALSRWYAGTRLADRRVHDA